MNSKNTHRMHGGVTGAAQTLNAAENERLAVLASYRILDTPPEPVFDSVVALAATLCGTPIAFLSFLTEERQWFKAALGLGGLKETPREGGVCHHTIQMPGWMEIQDARADARFCDHPMVAGEPKLRFYAGLPLAGAQGHRLGTLCVADHRPRELTGVQRTVLQQIAEIVMRLLESRKTEHRAASLGEMPDRLHQAAVEGLDDGIAILNAESRYVYLNTAHVKLYGYDHPDELIGKTWTVSYAPDEIARIEREVFPALMRDGRWIGEAAGQRRNGTTFSQGLSFTRLPHGHLICVCRDITAQKLAEEALFREKELAQVTLRSISDAVITTDIDARITYLNPIAQSLTGWSSDDACGKPVDAVFHVVDASTRQPARNPLQVALADNRIVGLAIDAVLINRDGTEVAIEDSAAPLHERNGRVAGGVLIFRDISEAHSMALRMAHLAQHDPLTGLPNRVLLRDRIAHAAALAQRHQCSYALLMIDLDQFKQVNDSLGHDMGDVVLVEMARRLKACVRESDTVCRHGGDEFMILLSEITRAEDAEQVASKMLEACARPLVVSDHELQVGASIGIAVLPDGSADAEAALRNADAAMYHAKQQGRNNFQFYSPGMTAHARERLTLRHELRHALANGEFVLHYQPQVDIETLQIVGCEALIRWQHPTRGLVAPGEFIPQIEESGLIVPIGQWVLRAACVQLRQWLEAGITVVPVSVNVSGAQFRRARFHDDVFQTIADRQIDPRMIVLELTESTIMDDPQAVAAMLQELKARGVRISIDDFGTGYSSLGQLRRFPIDTLKIDRSFVGALTAAPDDKAIVSAIVSMAKSLRQEVVAEGVETVEQLNLLRALGCDTAQGYLFYRPLDAAAFAACLRADRGE